MNKFVKGALAVGGGAVAAEGLRMAIKSTGRKPRYEPWERQPYKDFPNRVLILGGGFAGFKAAEALCKKLKDRGDVGVMVISKENFFTFWPMIASVISSDMATKNVAQPLRRGLIELGASFRRAEVQSIDLENQVVTVRGDLAGEQQFPYDHLIMALGGEPAYFGIPGVEDHAISMTGIGTAEDIRNRMIERYEEVTLRGGELVDSKLTFVIIGGGATGVETASELHELVHVTLAPDYPNINPHKVRIILLDRNEEILRELDTALRRTARRKLADLQIEVWNEVSAKEIKADRVILEDGREIEAENVIWTAGARASVKLEDLDLPSDERKGLNVDTYMLVEGHDNIWGVGDCAANVDEEGNPIPPNAQAATQGGEAVANNVLAAIDGEPLQPFNYKSLGQLVEMGSQFAVNDVMGVQFSGLIAALFWRATYLFKLESPQSRSRIATDWILDLFSHPSVTQIRGRE